MAEPDDSDVLKIRIPRDASRKLTREARRRQQSRGTVASAILVERLTGGADKELDAEARRQSLLVRAHESEQEFEARLVDTSRPAFRVEILPSAVLRP